MLALPLNIFLVAAAMAISFSSQTLLILVGGLIGSELAPKASYATLPIAIMIVGTAISTIPASMIMSHFGRRNGYLISLGVAVLAVVLGIVALMQANFYLYLLSSVGLGFNLAFTFQGRFIVLENAQNEKQQADGLTLILLASLMSALIGPQIGVIGKELFVGSPDYTGAYAILIAVFLLSMLIMCFYKELPRSEPQTAHHSTWSEILKRPSFISIAGSLAIGYGIMSLVMTATPLSMAQIDGHSIKSTTFVIQTHLLAMFLPSIVTGYLIKRGLRRSLIYTGLCAYVIVSIIALQGHHVVHYWWALLLLGIGWNLIFMTSTVMLPDSYQEHEKYTAQAVNDFIVFGFQALAALSAGWLLFNYNWSGVLVTGATLTLVWLCLMTLLFRRQLQRDVN